MSAQLIQIHANPNLCALGDAVGAAAMPNWNPTNEQFLFVPADPNRDEVWQFRRAFVPGITELVDVIWVRES
jgi:hypothetical protein